VIIIIGILSAIALPSFLSQAAKSKQTEAKTFVGAVNRAQQAHRMENIAFSSDLASLQVNIPTQTEYYLYTIPTAAATNTIFNAVPVGGETSTLRAYAGGVSVLTNGQTSAAACMTTAVSGAPPTISFSATGAACASAANNMK
ncbi:MAG: type IV pilin-like G/H family protein, partial [Dolichospermum sp.]